MNNGVLAMPLMTHHRRGRLATALLAFLILCQASCGSGSGQGLDESGGIPQPPSGNDNDPAGTDTGGGPASGNPDATLSWLQANVFGGVCTQCHTGAGAPLGVDWSSASASCANIGRASGEIPSMLEVKSGDPAGSYLVWKVEGQGPGGEAIVGSQMPLSNPPLSTDTIKNLKDWISDGTPGCQSSSQSIASDKATESGIVQATGADDTGAPGWGEVWHGALRDCVVCHSLEPVHPDCSTTLQCPPAGIVLGRDDYELVVNGYTVNPFDPAGSRLWQSVTSADPNRRMPLGMEPLGDMQLELILEWIRTGAPDCPEGQSCQ